MAGFPEHRQALTDAAFATFGEDAAWADREKAVRVRLKSRDEEQGFGGTRIVEKVLTARVRSWELAEPVKGDAFDIATGPNAGRYVVTDRPMLDAKGVWDCDVEREAIQ